MITLGAIRPMAALLSAAPLAWVFVAASGQASANGHTYSATNEKWKTECAECHVAYPPQLLPPSSWKAVMAGLDKHFGTDATLDPATAGEISAFLQRNAGRERGMPGGTPTLRITESRWFVREHDELPASIWNHPRVKTAANCSACHIGADQGNYNEHNIRVPK
jgi:cytochrome c553